MKTARGAVSALLLLAVGLLALAGCGRFPVEIDGAPGREANTEAAERGPVIQVEPGASCAAGELYPESQQPYPARVVRIVDGDTVTVQAGGRETRLRLWGIDAPEMGQPMGTHARGGLSSLAPAGEEVMVHPVTVDQYGRVVAVLGTEEPAVSVNFVLVAMGMAYHVNRWDSQGNRCLMAAEGLAKERKMGVWDRERVRPWHYRRERR